MIYDAALRPEVWRTFLDRLVACSNSRSGLLIFQNADNHAIGHTVQSGLDDSLHDPGRAISSGTMSGRRSLSCDQVYPACATAAPQEFQHSPIDNEFFRSAGNGHRAGAFISTEGPWSIRLDLRRCQSQIEFSDAEIQHLQKLVPHLRRGARIGREAGVLRGNFEATIEWLPTPCILLNGDREVIALNSRARQLIDNNDHGLLLKQDRLSLKHPALAGRLETLIRDSHQTAAGGLGLRGGIVKLPRKNQPPLILSVTSFCHPTGAGFLHCDGMVALFFYDSQRRLYPDAQLLIEIFGLTRGEARVALQLTTGRELEEIARALDVSTNAVKFHLKSIYAKTGTHRQSEVVSLLLSFLAQTQDGNCLGLN